MPVEQSAAQPPLPVRDLSELLATLGAVRREGEYVFVAVAADHPAIASAEAVVREPEAVTLVLARADADAAGLEYGFVAAWITLTVFSSLEAVGLTAAVARRLTEAGISCNVIAGFHHDHLLVPVSQSERALEVLARIAQDAGERSGSQDVAKRSGSQDATPDLRIRPFQPADGDRVVALWRDAGVTRPWNDPVEDVRRKRAVQPDLFLVAERDGDLVGAVMAGYDGHRGWLHYLAVQPMLQRGGVGRALVARAEAELAELGCPKVQLQVRADNTRVVAFYESLGYEPYQVVDLGKRLVHDEA